MDIFRRVLNAAEYYGRREDGFSSHVDNLSELSVVAKEQTRERHDAAVAAAFAFGYACGMHGRSE